VLKALSTGTTVPNKAECWQGSQLSQLTGLHNRTETEPASELIGLEAFYKLKHHRKNHYYYQWTKVESLNIFSWNIKTQIYNKSIHNVSLP
jgi:hypothetical protein